ncbi:hypothetical protein ACVPPR_01705 [Dellaglioa sp. L3N]
MQNQYGTSQLKGNVKSKLYSLRHPFFVNSLFLILSMGVIVVATLPGLIFSIMVNVIIKYSYANWYLVWLLGEILFSWFGVWVLLKIKRQLFTKNINLAVYSDVYGVLKIGDSEEIPVHAEKLTDIKFKTKGLIRKKENLKFKLDKQQYFFQSIQSNDGQLEYMHKQLQNMDTIELIKPTLEGIAKSEERNPEHRLTVIRHNQLFFIMLIFLAILMLLVELVIDDFLFPFQLKLRIAAYILIIGPYVNYLIISIIIIRFWRKNVQMIDVDAIHFKLIINKVEQVILKKDIKKNQFIPMAGMRKLVDRRQLSVKLASKKYKLVAIDSSEAYLNSLNELLNQWQSETRHKMDQ